MRANRTALQVTAEAVDAYRQPQLVRGWEAGMVSFLVARLSGGKSRSNGSTPPQGVAAAAATPAVPTAPAAATGGLEDAGLAVRFASVVAAVGTPVLIVHGAGDRLVPAVNSFRLARLLPGSRLAVLKRAGHCPQEETPDLFADLVAGWLQHASVGVGAAGRSSS